MRNIFVGLLASVFCLALLAVSSFESNAQSRPGMGAGADVATDCVPDGGGSSAQKQQKK